MIRFRLFLAGKGRVSLRGTEPRHRLTRGRGGGCSQEVQVPANGEVEGPPKSADQAPRAHTVPRRLRRVNHHRSRSPPTIVSRPASTCIVAIDLCDRLFAIEVKAQLREAAAHLSKWRWAGEEVPP